MFLKCLLKSGLAGRISAFSKWDFSFDSQIFSYVGNGSWTHFAYVFELNLCSYKQNK